MPATATPAITVVAAIIRGNDGRICLSRRPDHKHQGGRWEFPGGKVEPGETLSTALARELEEELGMQAALSSPFMTIAHQYEDLHVTLHFRDVTDWQGEPRDVKVSRWAGSRSPTCRRWNFRRRTGRW